MWVRYSNENFKTSNRSTNVMLAVRVCDENLRRPDKRRHSLATTHLNSGGERRIEQFERADPIVPRYHIAFWFDWRITQCNRIHRRFDDLRNATHHFSHVHPHPTHLTPSARHTDTHINLSTLPIHTHSYVRTHTNALVIPDVTHAHDFGLHFDFDGQHTRTAAVPELWTPY